MTPQQKEGVMKEMLAKFSNIEGTVTITVFDDISYELHRNDYKDNYTMRFDMTKWYLSGNSVVNHVKNDIKDGVWGDLYEVVMEAK
jgi:hypothetical protein